MELKQKYGFDVARESGLFNMDLQAVITIFVVNMKRIMTLINRKLAKRNEESTLISEIFLVFCLTEID